MVSHNGIDCAGVFQGTAVQLSAVFKQARAPRLVSHLKAHRYRGRHGYPVLAMWRAYLASFVLNLPSTNALIRRLQDDAKLRTLCGLPRRLPHRRTFNKFIRQLSDHPELVEQCLASLTDRLKARLPGLGDELAVDSTVVRTHANPNRRTITDPQASWTAKNSAGAKEGGKEWRYGYKLHMVADANYGLPLAVNVTTASRNDSPLLPPLMDTAMTLHPWLRPSAVTADRGYDSATNHRYLLGTGALPIIHIRRNPHGTLFGGIYTKQGVPTCLGQIPMEYVRSDPELGHLYRCVGCHLKESVTGGLRHCDTEVWEDPGRNVRLFGALRRDSPRWKALYAKRQAIERVFKSMKESRRLERHAVRGLRQITLHAIMSTLTYQATALVRVLTGQQEHMRWMVRRVA